MPEEKTTSNSRREIPWLFLCIILLFLFNQVVYLLQIRVMRMTDSALDPDVLRDISLVVSSINLLDYVLLTVAARTTFYRRAINLFCAATVLTYCANICLWLIGVEQLALGQIMFATAFNLFPYLFIFVGAAMLLFRKPTNSYWANCIGGFMLLNLLLDLWLTVVQYEILIPGSYEFVHSNAFTNLRGISILSSLVGWCLLVWGVWLERRAHYGWKKSPRFSEK